MNATQTALVPGMRLEQTVLNVRITGVATSGGQSKNFAGLRGQVADGPLAGAAAFIPASCLTESNKRHPDFLVDHSTLSVIIIELKEKDGRHSLVCNERLAVSLLAEREQHTVIARIDKLAMVSNSGRLAGFSGEICSGVLTGMKAFFPCSQVVDRPLPPEQFIGKTMIGVVVGKGENGSFVLSERRAAKALFDKVEAGYRLRMTVEIINGEVWMRQLLARGLPLVGKLDVSHLHGKDLPPVGSEFFVVVTGKETIWKTPDDAGVLLVKAEKPVVTPGHAFCVTCQEEHGQNGICDPCGGCLYTHGHQIFEGNGHSTDGCFIACENCGQANFCD